MAVGRPIIIQYAFPNLYKHCVHLPSSRAFSKLAELLKAFHRNIVFLIVLVSEVLLSFQHLFFSVVLPNSELSSQDSNKPLPELIEQPPRYIIKVYGKGLPFPISSIVCFSSINNISSVIILYAPVCRNKKSEMA